MLSSLLQLCEYLEELLNMNGELRSEGQDMWTLLGGILGQVSSLNVHKQIQMLHFFINLDQNTSSSGPM